jgi:hypothetical protein
MTLSANLGKAAPPHQLPVTIDGEECLLEGQRIGLADWAKLSQILYRKHVTSLIELRDAGAIGEPDFDKQLAKLSTRYNSGKFSLEAPEFRSWLASTEGTCHCMIVIFNIDFRQVVQVVTCPEAKQVMALVGLVIKESMPVGKVKTRAKTAKESAADPGVLDPNAGALESSSL